MSQIVHPGKEVPAGMTARARSGPESRTPAQVFPGVPGSGQARTVRVPWASSAVPGIRRTIVADLVVRGVSAEIIDEAEIVVSELVANAIRHARALPDGTVRVHWKVKNDQVEVEVSDGGGPTQPRPAPRSAWTAAGRGLRIVRSLAHEWGVQEDRGGRTVWAALGGPSRRRST
jgi:anti-sigma regulatory factor (Ser/Thr protein kinase)